MLASTRSLLGCDLRLGSLFWGPLVEVLLLSVPGSFNPSALSLQMSIFLIYLCVYAGFKKHDRSHGSKGLCIFPLSDKARRSVVLGQTQVYCHARLAAKLWACGDGRLLDISCYWRQNIFCQSSEIAQQNLVISSLFLFSFIHLF